MDITEALEWLDGKRSMINVIPQDRFETWQVRVAQADAAMMQQAYWVVSGQRRNRMGDVESRCPECGETEPVLHCEQCGHNWHHLTNKSSRQDITKPLKVKVQTKKLKRWKPQISRRFTNMGKRC